MHPNVGTAVHWVGYTDPDNQGPETTCMAAIVTDISGYDPTDPGAGLAVAVLSHKQFRTDYTGGARDETNHAAGTWHWPEPAPVDPPD